MVRPDPVGPGQESVWDYPRPPALVRDAREVVVRCGDVEVARTNREEALRRVAGLLGGRLHDLLLESSLP